MYRFSCWCVLVSTLPDLLIRIKSTKKTQLILIFFIAQCTITLLNSLPLSGHSAPAVSGLSLNLLSKGVKLSRGQRGSCCRRMELCRQHAWGPGGENHLHYIFFHVIRLDCVWIAKQRPDLAWIDPNWRIKPLAEVAGVILDGWLDHGQVGTRSTFLASLIKYVIYHICIYTSYIYMIYSRSDQIHFIFIEHKTERLQLAVYFVYWQRMSRGLPLHHSTCLKTGSGAAPRRLWALLAFH